MGSGTQRNGKILLTDSKKGQQIAKPDRFYILWTRVHVVEGGSGQ
jgi:hypothetical protein